MRRTSLSSWLLAPRTCDGEPAAVEVVRLFYTDDTTTTGEIIGKTVPVIVLMPLAVALALLSGDEGFLWGM